MESELKLETLGAPRPAGSQHLSYAHEEQVQHRVIAELVCKYTPRGRVLDIGCGLGHTLRLLSRRNPALELWGADIDQVCLHRTQERVASVRTVRMRDETLDVSVLPSDFHTTIMGHVLEHTTYPLDALHKALSTTRLGGHLIIATPNPVRPDVLISSILRRHYVNRGHVHAWDRSHRINFLENAAMLNVVEHAVDEVRLLPGWLRRHLGLVEKLHVAAARVLPWLSFSNIAVIQNV